MDEVRASIVWCVLAIGSFLLAGGGACTSQAAVTVGPGTDYDFSTIQAAIDAADNGDVVLVAPGEYVIAVPITFRGKAITVRSETGPDQTVIRMVAPNDPKRASVVVFENDETPASVLEGFTLTGGRGCRSTDPSTSAASGLAGGGIAMIGSSATVVACIITKNTADTGGGMDASYRSAPVLTDCIIRENSVLGSGGGICCWDNSSLTMTECLVERNSAPGTTMYVNGNGGGIFCGQRSELKMTNCNISENSAGINGAGLSCQFNSVVTMTNCSITNNTSGRWSAGLGSGHCLITLTNCIIADNSANAYCGGIETGFQDSSLTIRNCTIVANSAGQWGGGIICWAGASCTVTNSILWDNVAPSGREVYLQQSPSVFHVAYSNVSGGSSGVYVGTGSIDWGEGNIDANPCFAEVAHWGDVNNPNPVVGPDDPNAVWIEWDYHLKSEVGRWDPRNDSWVVDEITSPCIDRGDPNSPIGDEADPNGGCVNMGAYGGTQEASMSIGMLPPLPPLAHWKLDEGEGYIASDAIGENDGTLIGDPTWRPGQGAINGALEFDGADDAVAAAFVLDPAYNSFSVLAWVKDGAPGQVIVSQEGGTDWLLADADFGNLQTTLSKPGTSGRKATPPEPPLTSKVAITDGNWHRIGFTWDGNCRRLYVDDALVAEDTQSSLASSSGGLHIGCGSDMTPGTFWKGLIDDVRVYNYAVSEPR
ncbi:MAG: hypothetical protein JW741_27640 [Sedimentisphaerales bacterium]|nr:hypothetical protein [Sedimentisphaerales bacterium]